jgi:hypothetical protein
VNHDLVVMETQKECVKIQHRLEQATDAVKPFKVSVDQARVALRDAQDDLSNFTVNCDPKNAYLDKGQFTESYRTFRVGSWALFAEMIAVGEECHSEKSAFIADHMDTLAIVLDYSTDELRARMRQSAREQAARDADHLFPEKSKPAPSGQDIVNEIHSAMEGQQLTKLNDRNVIEDLGNRPAVVRKYSEVLLSGLRLPW